MNKKGSIKNFWNKIWKLIVPSRRQIKNLFVLILFLEALRLIGPYIFKIIVDRVVDFKIEEINIILFLIALMFAFNQIVSLIDYLIDKKLFKVISDIIAYLSNNAHKKMVFLGLEYHEKENTGNKIIKIRRGIDKIENLLGNFFWEVAPTVF